MLRTAFERFARKLEVAADEAAKVVGKGARAAALAGGAAASGQLPKLLELLELANKVLQHLG